MTGISKAFRTLLLFFPLMPATCCTTAFAQDLAGARRHVSILTSENFAGRGYVGNGCGKAADFILAQFDSIGLKKFPGGFAQLFTLPVNTFPGDMEVKIDGRALEPGHDFIVHPHSAGAKKKYSLKPLHSYASPSAFNDHPGVCYVVRLDSLPEKDRMNLTSDLLSGVIRSGALIQLFSKKLTWSVARSHYAIPVISVLENCFPDSAISVSFAIKQKFIPEFKARNLIGYVEGAVRPDSFLVVTAHYDHLGKMGRKTFFPGANDNASGVSMLLNLANYFSREENRPAYSIAFIAFAAEEAGLVGSEFYTQHPLFPLKDIRFLINLDLLGTGDDGIMVVNATEYPEEFALLDSINTKHGFLPGVGRRGKAKNSDHYHFSENGVPAFFFYTMGGIQAYHDVYDRAETLPFTEFEDVFRLIVEFSSALTRR